VQPTYSCVSFLHILDLRFVLIPLCNIILSSFLGSTAQLRPWPPPQNSAEFLGGFSTIFFLQGRAVSPTPNPHPGGPGLCIYIPQMQGGYPFWSLLRHAWVTVGLFLFPGHHTGICNIIDIKYLIFVVSSQGS
jgi:hypothetical protein